MDPIFEISKPEPASLLIVGTPPCPESAQGGLPEPLHGYVPVAEFYNTWFKLVGPNGELVETDLGYLAREPATGPDGEIWVLESQKAHSRRGLMSLPNYHGRTGGICSLSRKETITLTASGLDAEDGENVDGFEWSLTLYDGEDAVVETKTISGKSGTYSLPTEIDIEGRLEITVTGKDTIGNVRTAQRTLVPDASRHIFL